MKSLSHCILMIASLIAFTACGRLDLPNAAAIAPELSTLDTPNMDQSVVRARAIYTITSEQPNLLAKLFRGFLMSAAYASNGSTTVTYTNSPSTSFSINVSSFSAGSFSGNTLSLGSIALSGLSDNNLKVCGTNGNTKCTQAVIRAYTSGTLAGFVNTAEAYGVPVYAGSLNPNVPLGLNTAGSVQMQTLNIPNSKHTVTLSDFSSPSYAVSADFSNGGAGSYFMTYVLEFALLP